MLSMFAVSQTFILFAILVVGLSNSLILGLRNLHVVVLSIICFLQIIFIAVSLDLSLSQATGALGFFGNMIHFGFHFFVFGYAFERLIEKVSPKQ